jgi:hypothetical protein
MSDRSTQAPLFVDALALAQWLMAHFAIPGAALETQLVTLGLELPQVLTLALKNRCRDERIEEADELLIRLRVLLRLAVECGRLTSDQYGHVLERVDVIGAQLGAWKKSLGPV